MKMPSSKALDRNVGEWFTKIKSGEIKLPRFQRHQAWDKHRICSLLDTVTMNLPLGVTLVLNIGEEEHFVSRYLASAPETGSRVTEHLLDGQQRLTALWRTLHNNYPSEKYFLHIKKYDQRQDAKNEDSEMQTWHQPRWLNKSGSMMPLWADSPSECFYRGLIPMDLFRPGDIADEYDAWISQAIKDLKPNSSTEHFEDRFQEWMELKDDIKSTIRDIRETIAHFNLPYLALPYQTSKDTALQVFINMNTNSKPLSQYDIIRAEIEGVKGVSLDDYQFQLNNKFPNIQRYFELPFLILATSALMQDKLPNQRGMWDMAKDKMVENWDRMALGLNKMAEFMQHQGIYDHARLPTNAVLAVIAALYTHIPENLDLRGRFEALLKKYLWSSFFTDRYENSAATHAYSDFMSLKRVIQGVKKENGDAYTENDVAVLNRDSYPVASIDELMKAGWPKQQNIRARAILAVFTKLGAYDFADGTQLTPQQLLDGRRHYHHVFPDALLKEATVESYLALNCALITDKTNLNISNKNPWKYLQDRYNWSSEDEVDARLKSHLIPVKELRQANYDGLEGEQKCERIKQDFENFLKKRAEYVFRAATSLTEGKDIYADQIINEMVAESSTVAEE